MSDRVLETGARVAPAAPASETGTGDHGRRPAGGGPAFADLLAQAEAVQDRIELSRRAAAPGLGLRMQAAIQGAAAFVLRQAPGAAARTRGRRTDEPAGPRVRPTDP